MQPSKSQSDLSNRSGSHSQLKTRKAHSRDSRSSLSNVGREVMGRSLPKSRSQLIGSNSPQRPKPQKSSQGATSKRSREESAKSNTIQENNRQFTDSPHFGQRFAQNHQFPKNNQDDIYLVDQRSKIERESRKQTRNQNDQLTQGSVGTPSNSFPFQDSYVIDTKIPRVNEGLNSDRNVDKQGQLLPAKKVPMKGRATQIKMPLHTADNFKSSHLIMPKPKNFESSSSDSDSSSANESKSVSDVSSPKKTPSSAKVSDQGKPGTDRSRGKKKKKLLTHQTSSQLVEKKKKDFKKKRLSVYFARRPSNIINQIEMTSDAAPEQTEIPKFIVPNKTVPTSASKQQQQPTTPRKTKEKPMKSPKSTQIKEIGSFGPVQPQQASYKSIYIEQLSSNTPKADRKTTEKQQSRLDVVSQDRRFSEVTINSVKRLSIMQRKSVNESQKQELIGTLTETPLDKKSNTDSESSNQKTIDKQIEEQLEDFSQSQSSPELDSPTADEAPVSFEDTTINQLIHSNRSSGAFADWWSNIILASNTFNFITAWYFLGQEGFPSGAWLTAELIVEVVMFSDFVLRQYFKTWMANQWRTMWLLQQKEKQGSWLECLFFFIASIPQSFVFYLVFRDQPSMLNAFPIAALRHLKMLRYKQISKYFETKEIENQVNNVFSNIRTIKVVFYFLMATHMIGCIWLVIGRIDPNRQNWFVMARYTGDSAADNWREVTEFEKYIDSVFYTVATMTGLGYGNVVPSTNLEYFVDIFIMITGSSIYAGFFADFAVEIYNQNKRTIENEQKLEQAKKFAVQRNLPDDIRERIRMYYHNLRLNFQLLNDKFNILHQLPETLRSELSLFFNVDLIQKVKFFQLADPAFILAMSRTLKPQICLQHDFVVEVDQVAQKMYFISSGIVQILATDNKTIIAFQSQGCYFGEIGILLTSKRSCSVKAVSKCSFMTITKEEIEKIFLTFPAQGKFLRAIGRQRLQTTKPEDLDDTNENMFEAGDGENFFVADSVFNNGPTSDYHGSQDKKAPDIQVNGQSESSLKESISSPGMVPEPSSGAADSSNPKTYFKRQDTTQMYSNKLHQTEDFSKPTSHQGSESIDPIESWRQYEDQNCLTAFIRWLKLKLFLNSSVAWNLTEEFAEVKHFVIIPFSSMYNVWTSIVVTSFLYFVMIVPYQLALDYDILEEGGWPYFIPDICCSCVFVLDIWVRSKIAFVVNARGESDFQTCIDQIHTYYVNNLLLWDLLAAIPMDYLLIPFQLDPALLRALRVLKFCKTRMFFQFITILRKHSQLPKSLITFSLFFLLFIIIGHFMATTYIFIGRREMGRAQRFDGQTMFSDITSRNFITPGPEIEDKSFYSLPPAEDMTKIELYIQFIYLSSCTMGAVMYGDIIPFAMSEQLFDFIAMFTCRIFLAFLFAEAASYLSSLHNSQSQHTTKVHQMMNWCDQNQIPKPLKQRIKNLYSVLWRNFKGVRQQMIIQDLPESLQQDVRSLIFKNIIEKWDIFLDQKEDKGAVSSIVQQLELRLIPKGEFIIRYGETAQHMFFIIKGVVTIISAEGIHLAQIGEGKNFGEMALLRDGETRSASVQTETDVSVAIMATKDFKHICDLYPSFKKIIEEVAEKRQKENKTTIKKIIQESKALRANLHLSVSPSNSRDSIFEEEKEAMSSPRKDEPHNESKRTAIMSSLQNTLSGGRPEGTLDSNQSTINKVTKQVLPMDFQEDTNRSALDSSSQALGTMMGDEGRTNRPLIPDNSPINVKKSDLGQMQYKKKSNPSSNTSSNNHSDFFNDKQPVAHKIGGAPYMPSKRRYSRVSLKTGAIQDHFEIQSHHRRSENIVRDCLRKSCSMRDFMKWSILFVSIYNLIFIPLQFAYRIGFKGPYFVMEVFTVVLYVFDIYYRKRNLNYLQMAGGNIPDSQNEIEQTLMDDKDQFFKRLRLIKIEIFCSFVASIPFSFVMQLMEYREPQPVVICLSLLRLVKILPFLKMFDNLKSFNMQRYRVIEVLVLYYFICHVITCIWITMAHFHPDIRETWIRRIPVLQEAGMRSSKEMDDVTSTSLYIHALYFVVNTVSHVAIGDITAVNNKERIFVAILILFGTFIYVFLYGNIISIVSDYAPSKEIDYIEKYKYVMQRMDSLKNEKRLMGSITEYFDFIWGNDLDTVEVQLMNDLPHSIKSDILLCKYQEAIESSLLFKDDQGAIDVSLTNSIIRMFQTRLYLSDELVFRLGSVGQNTFIIIEGKALLVGGCDAHYFHPHDESDSDGIEAVGFMHPGSHFGNNLPEGCKNYSNKRVCQLVSLQPTVMGIISIQDIQILYQSFPQWKQKMQSLNLFTFKKCEAALEKHDEEMMALLEKERANFQPDLMSQYDIREIFLEHHFTYTGDDEYHRFILNMKHYVSKCVPDFNNLVVKQKMFFYGQKGKIFPIFDTQYAEALKLKSHQSLISRVYEGADPSLNQSQTINSSEEFIKFTAWLQQMYNNFYFYGNSKRRRIVDHIQLFNLIYVAVMTPLVVGFSIEMLSYIQLAEVISLLMSIAWIIINFRTQLIIKGVATLKFKTIYANYRHNGLILDICGIIPFNLLLGQNFGGLVIPRALLRQIRVLSSWRALFLFQKTEATFKNNRFNAFIQIMKAFLYISFLGHFLACAFYFMVSNVEDNDDETWIKYNVENNGLDTDNKLICYLRSIYTVFNIVCSVGYGDMFPMTDTERVFFTLMITSGDMLFAMAFGLITRITLMISLQDETKQFKDKMYQIQDFLKQFNLDQAQLRRVEQYFAFEYKQKYNSNLLSYRILEGYLPLSLRQRVKYRVCRDLLLSLFSEYESENLIRRLAIVLEARIFLPGDYIIYKGEIGEEMYFMAEGLAYVLLEDKQTVVQTIKKGDHFGEMAILFKAKRINYVQAESFCIINVLTKSDFDEIVKDFPDIAESLKERASFSQKHYSNLEQASETSDNPVQFTILNEEEMRQFHEDHQTAKKSRKEPKLNNKKGLIDSRDIIHEERSSQFNSSTSNQSSYDDIKTKSRQIVIQESDEALEEDEDISQEEGDENLPQQQASLSSPGIQNVSIQGNYDIILERNSRNKNTTAHQSGDIKKSSETKVKESSSFRQDTAENVRQILHGFDIGDVTDSDEEEGKEDDTNKTNQALLDKTHSPKSAKEEGLDFTNTQDQAQGFEDYCKVAERPRPHESRSSTPKSLTDQQVIENELLEKYRRYSIMNKKDSVESLNEFFSATSGSKPSPMTETEAKMFQKVLMKKKSSNILQRPSSMNDAEFQMNKLDQKSYSLVNPISSEERAKLVKGASDRNLIFNLEDTKSEKIMEVKGRDSLVRSQTQKTAKYHPPQIISNSNLLSLNNQTSLGLTKMATLKSDSQNTAMFGGFEKQLSMRSSNKSFQKVQKQTTIMTQPGLGNMFKKTSVNGKGEELINHTIRRTITSKQPLLGEEGRLLSNRLSSSKQTAKTAQTPEEEEKVEKKQLPVRRLSRISLGKNLTLSKTVGLKLQWTVGA